MPFLLPTLPACPAQPSPGGVGGGDQSEEGGRRREGQGGEATLSHPRPVSLEGGPAGGSGTVGWVRDQCFGILLGWTFKKYL